MSATLSSKRFTASDEAAAVELAFDKGWSDGLPVVPPTEPRVRAMLEAARLEPGQQIGFVAHRAVSITAEKVAINAVMAGCRPEYMPVVVAAVQGIADPRWSYHGPGTSTGGAAVLMIVNGPVARTLDINAGDNLFGPGWRSNLTIGRAVRLVMRNVCGSLPGLLDRGTLGHPGKLSFVIAENEAESPWTPLHVERGLRPDQSAVTVIASDAPHQFYNQLSPTAEGVLTTLADDMRISGSVMGQSTYVVVLAGEHTKTIAASGWDKKRIREFLFEKTHNSHAHLKRTQRMSGDLAPGDEDKMRPLVASPDDIVVVAAGGRAGAFSCYIPGWGSAKSSQARHQGDQAMIEILDPTTEAATQTIAYAPRPSALAGKRVALIENTKFNSDRLLVKIGDILKAEHGIAEWKLYRKHNASVPAHAEIIDEVKKSADVMVAGIGD